MKFFLVSVFRSRAVCKQYLSSSVFHYYLLILKRKPFVNPDLFTNQKEEEEVDVEYGKSVYSTSKLTCSAARLWIHFAAIFIHLIFFLLVLATEIQQFFCSAKEINKEVGKTKMKWIYMVYNNALLMRRRQENEKFFFFRPPTLHSFIHSFFFFLSLLFEEIGFSASIFWKHNKHTHTFSWSEVHFRALYLV